MAYDQGGYQPPQRPYNGRAAQPPAPAYNNNRPAQNYGPPQNYGSQGGYDGYAQGGDNGYDDGYGNGGNGYAQDYDNGYGQNGPGGNRGGGGGGGYPPQNNQNYPPGPGYGGPPGPGRGGPDMRSQQSRNDLRGPAPYGQPPPRGDSARGGYDDRRGGGAPRGGNPNGGGPGRGGRPAPLDRAPNSDPGVPRRPVQPALDSPQEVAWDNPFPGFPGAKKKTSVSEEQRIVGQMAGMDLNGRPDDGRGPRSEPRGSPESMRRGQEGYGRPPGNGGPPPPRGYPLQQGYGPGPGQRGPPGPGYGNGRGGPNGDSYGPAAGFDDGYGKPSTTTPTPQNRDGFGPPSRSMTMPTNVDREGNFDRPYPPLDVPGDSAPYNGPIGRPPPRPSTAGGQRPPPQRQYPPPDQEQGYSNGQPNGNVNPQRPAHQNKESISDLYDHYFDEGTDNHGRSTSLDQGRIAGELEEISLPRQQMVNGAQPSSSSQNSQYDERARVQPQSAVYEMAGGPAPPMPNMPNNSQNLTRNDSSRNQEYLQNQGNQGYQNPYNQYGNQQPPGRQGSFGRGQNTYGQGGPQAGYGGPPGPNGGPRMGQSEGLPPHPVPVRAGLIPGNNTINDKPPPVRNYNGSISEPASRQSPAPAPPAAADPDGPPVTNDEIERLRASLTQNPNDQNTQMTLAKKLALAAEILVPQIPDQRTRNKTRERYVLEAHKLLKKLVALGNVDAMFYLADCYGRGALGLEPDNKEAFTLYQSAAKAGHAAAAYRTAVCCELGNDEGGGTRKDPLKAIQWYKRAATLGDTPAMYKMGMIQLKGLLGQPKDPREAIGWLKRAADRADPENPHALHELALLYEKPTPPDGSNTVIRDEAYSLSLFTQAANLGYKFSQFRLGAAYEYGLFGLAIDPRQSIMWYSRAAVQEEHQSELALSGWYLTGATEGPPGQEQVVLQQSDTEAYLWARKAATAGLAKAEYAMGYFLEVGIGCPKDPEGAKRWYWRAATQNDVKARTRLEELKRGGAKGGPQARERISRSKVGKGNEGECLLM